MATVLPRVLSKHPLSMPMALIALGYIAVKLPLGLEVPNIARSSELIERTTEIGVIVSLMGAGLKIDRVPGLKSWNTTWRLLTITMLLTISLTAVAAWGIGGFLPATALLLAAVLAPTDPVLASDVQVGSPMQGSLGEDVERVEGDPPDEDEIRFALTSEAGLNDGLAFPFTNMAIMAAAVGMNPSRWISEWLLLDVIYKIFIGILCGIFLGKLLARFILTVPAKTMLSKSMLGLGALAATFIIYGSTQAVGGYGFIATFVGAVTIRNADHSHEHHGFLYHFAEKAERLMTVGMLLAFGGAIAIGLLSDLTWELATVGLLLVLVIRPSSGLIGMIGSKKANPQERFAIGFFGVRGIGSVYYLAYAVNRQQFVGTHALWTTVGFVILLSVFLHGLTSHYIISKIDRQRQMLKANG